MRTAAACLGKLATKGEKKAKQRSLFERTMSLKNIVAQKRG